MKYIDLFLKGIFLGVCSILLSFPTPVSAETITIAGTGDSQLLLRQLAQVFQQQYPKAQILVPNSVGSGGGIKLLQAGRSELARIARPLKPKEKAEGLHDRTFAYSPIIFVANLPTPCVKSITAAEVKALFTGEINNWNQLGSCQDHKIYVANREEGDSSKSILEEKIPGVKQIKQLTGRTIYSTPEAYDTLNRYEHSFGYLPASQIEKGSLTKLDYEGIAPTIENVQLGKYPLAVPLGIVWRDEPQGVAKQFIDFLFSPKAQQLMLKMNAVPALVE